MNVVKGYDLLGNIAVVKFHRSANIKDKKKEALRILKTHKNTRTVLEKSDKIKGRLRVQKTKWILGEKTKEALYKENGCEFRFNVDSCYFSPRLSGDRIEIAKSIRKKENILVMFGGVAPYAIVAAKIAKPLNVVSVELGRECNKYAQDNIKRNKVDDKVKVIQGDVRKILPNIKEKFDRIVMTRPNLEDSFLDVAFSKIGKGGRIHYYGFYSENESGKLKELINREAENAGKRIKIIRVKKAGDIGVRKFRYRVDIFVLN